MGLYLICPHCLAKHSLWALVCGPCGADLRNLPAAERRYFLGGPTSEMEIPRTLEIIPAAAPDPVSREPFTESWRDEGYMEQADEMARLSLCETLDRVLNKGAVVVGEVVVSVANIDLLYLGLQLILTSIETARELRSSSRLELLSGGIR